MSWCWGLLLPRDRTSPTSLLNCERFPLAQLSGPSRVPLDGSTTLGYQLLLPIQSHLPTVSPFHPTVLQFFCCLEDTVLIAHRVMFLVVLSQGEARSMFTFTCISPE